MVPAPYTNPVFPGDAADPTVLRVNGRFYAAATESMYYGEPYRIGILRSDNLVHWNVAGEVFPDQLPAWVDPVAPSLWAPELTYHDGRYYLYFSAREAPGRHGIGVAWADHPEGPWSFADHPLVVGDSFRNIDPMIFSDDDGTRYMYWGSAHGPILVQELAPDGLSLIGEPKAVLYVAPGLPYQGLIEAPWVIKRGEHYYLFYSGNSPGEYAISVARATSPLGPFQRHPNNPIIEENEYFRAPGHNAIVQDDAGQDWILYHAYDRHRYGVGRHLMLDKIVWSEGWPVVNRGLGPSWMEQVDGPLFAVGFRESTGAGACGLGDKGQLSESQERPWPPLFDVARGKPAEASSVRGPEFEASYAVDGTTATRWAPAAGDPSPWITVDLEGVYRLQRVEIRFRSTHFTRTERDPSLTHDPFRIEQHYSYRIEHSLDGETWHVFADRTQPGQVAYPYIEQNDALARFVRLTITGVRAFQPDPGVYDLRVYGRREFWIETPGWNVPVSENAPVVARSVAGQSLRPRRTGEEVAGGVDGPITSVRVAVDGVTVGVYPALPMGPLVNPAELPDGRHRVSVEVARADGTIQSAQAEFWVKNTRITWPAEGAVLQKQVPIAVEIDVSPELIGRVRYTVSPVRVEEVARRAIPVSGGGAHRADDAKAGKVELCVQTGGGNVALDEPCELDTLRLPDGEYDLAVVVERTDGTLSMDVRRVRVHNWETLVDELLPPQNLAWFGTREALKVVSRSEGWRHATGDADEFFGDDDRLAVDGAGSGEYLVWRLPAVRAVSVVLYARDDAAVEEIQTSVSADGQDWRVVAYAVQERGRSAAGWRQLALTARVSPGPQGTEYEYFRLWVPGARGSVQLGEVVLTGEYRP